MSNSATIPVKENRLSIRANADQKRALARAAKARHMNLSQFVLQASLQEAARVIHEESELKVSAEEYAWLCGLLDAPPAAAPRLRAALAQKPAWEK